MKKAHVYKIGDAVFYPSAGVGNVESIEEIFLAGFSDTCYVIRIHETDMVVKVPRSNMERSGIRPLLETRRVKELYKVLKEKPSRRVTGGNWTERCKDLERRIHRGSPMDLGAVVRDLLLWKSQTGLSFEEAMLLETASAYLANELAAIQGVSREAAVGNIREQVGVAA